MNNIIRFFSALVGSFSGPVGNFISTIFALVSGLILHFYLHRNKADTTDNIEVLGSIALGFLVYNFMETFVRSVSFKNLEAKIEKDFDLFKDVNIYNSKIANELFKMSEKDQLLQGLMKRRFQSYLNDFYISYNRDIIEFKSQDSTMESFRDFWDLIIKQQKDRGNDRPINVFVTHAGKIDLYDNENNSMTQALLNKQYRFRKRGGKIFRIFINESGADKESDPPETYEKLMADMERSGVHVAYIDISGKPIGRYDLLISLPGKHTVEWERNTRGDVMRCTFSKTDEEFEKKYDSWKLILRIMEETISDAGCFTPFNKNFLEAFKSRSKV